MHMKGLLTAALLTTLFAGLGGCASQETKPEASANSADQTERQLKECYLVGQMYLWAVDDFTSGMTLQQAQDTSRRAFFSDVPQLAQVQQSVAQVVYQERPQGRYPASNYVRSKYMSCASGTDNPELGQKSTVCFNLTLLSEVVHEMRAAGQTKEQVAAAFAEADQNLSSYQPMIDAIYGSDLPSEDYNASLYTRCLANHVLAAGQ